MVPLYEDKYFLGVAKNPGEPVQPDQSGDESLLTRLESITGKNLFLLNRLDRPVGGVVLFAKTIQAADAYSRLLKTRQVQKYYLAVVEGHPEVKEKTLIQHLVKRGNKTHIVEEPKKGKEARLNVSLLGSGDRYSFLLIDLKTGRFHQIRAQLAGFGHPVKGDVKYGARRSNPDRSLHLHAWQLSFDHPFTGIKCTITAPVPTTDSLWTLCPIPGTDNDG